MDKENDVVQDSNRGRLAFHSQLFSRRTGRGNESQSLNGIYCSVGRGNNARAICDATPQKWNSLNRSTRAASYKIAICRIFLLQWRLTSVTLPPWRWCLRSVRRHPLQIPNNRAISRIFGREFSFLKKEHHLRISSVAALQFEDNFWSFTWHNLTNERSVIWMKFGSIFSSGNCRNIKGVKTTLNIWECETCFVKYLGNDWRYSFYVNWWN